MLMRQDHPAQLQFLAVGNTHDLSMILTAVYHDCQREFKDGKHLLFVRIVVVSLPAGVHGSDKSTAG